jgi:mannose-1-phosphate guanylyltransferase
MKAVILAGGIGERLRPLTNEKPKVLLPVHGKPIVEHLIILLKKYGIKDIILAVSYKAEMIKEYFGNGEKLGVNISYFVEEERLGTAGCLNYLKAELDKTFLMVNGDELINFDLNKLILFHKKHKKQATIALYRLDDISQFGVVQLNEKHSYLIDRFVEKPKKEEAPSNLINSGLYIIEPSIIKLIKDKKFAMMEKDVFPTLAQDGELAGIEMTGQWFDTGTHERYEQVQREWKDII